MLDIKKIRENPAEIRKNLEKRGSKEVLKQFDELLASDKVYREKLYQYEQLKSEKNNLSLKVNELKKKKEDIKDVVAQVKASNEKLNKFSEELEKHKSKWQLLLMKIPNYVHETVPAGADEKSNVEVKKWGEPKVPGFELISHAELAEKLNIADFDRATKISGAGWYFLKGDLALLNQALIRYVTDILLDKEFILIEPPHMMKREPYEGVTDLDSFDHALYKIEGEDLHLIATSEHPLTAMHMNETIDVDELPLKYAGLSNCFRKEIGSHGIDEKGLFRRHQFPKVEQVVICKPEDSWLIHEQMLKVAEEVFQALKLPYRIVILSAGDASGVSSKTYDLEIWFPRTKEYKEAVSCSNVTDYQARRLNIKYGKVGGERDFAHTLNSTAIATTRVLVAILENYQNADGSITIPEALLRYMRGKTIIKN